jgi:excisionase family DNA binding protein
LNRKEFYSVKEVAQILNLSPDRIYEYLRAGHLFGTRLTNHSAWRIPAAEIERLKGASSEKSSAQLDTKAGKWSEYLELAMQLQNSLSHVEPKDWAIWGLRDTGQPPLTSEAGLKIWIERGKLVVKLAVEQDKRFPLFMARLKTLFTEFKSYDQWRESLTDFVTMCWVLAHEIWSRAENETGLNLSPIPVMGKGHLLNVPQFIYEFALDNYSSGKQPDLEIFQSDPYRYGLVPAYLPNYVLAISSKDEMEKCKKVTISLTGQYVQDEKIGEIIARVLQMKKQTAPFQAALARVVREASEG